MIFLKQYKQYCKETTTFCECFNTNINDLCYYNSMISRYERYIFKDDGENGIIYDEKYCYFSFSRGNYDFIYCKDYNYTGHEYIIITNIKYKIEVDLVKLHAEYSNEKTLNIIFTKKIKFASISNN